MSDELPAGTLLSDRYEIIRTIGQGGMGSVYLASDRRLSVKRWAVKEMVLSGEDSQEKAEIESLFTGEAHILAGLDHPNLPRVMDFFSQGDRKYLIMEYVEGRTLENVVADTGGFLPVARVLDYALQIADVLSYLHNHRPDPIIFRDLKPSNVMVTDEQRIKLIDFGIARIFVSGKSKDTIILGTPGYASPEHYGRAQTDQRSDIFSFGATLYHLLTRQDPGASPFHFPPIRDINRDVPPALESLVLKSVSVVPDSRHSSFEEIISELRSISAAEPSAATSLIPPALQPAVTNILPLRQASDEISFEPPSLDFGDLKSGNIRQMSFKIIGDVKGTLTCDKKWIKVRPSSVKGANPVADAVVDTQGLKHGGAFLGNIFFAEKKRKIALPVKVTVQTQPLGFWSYVFAFVLTIASFLPGIGFLGFFLMLSLYYSSPFEERGTLSAFLIISSVISFLWLIALAFVLGHFFLVPGHRAG